MLHASSLVTLLAFLALMLHASSLVTLLTLLALVLLGSSCLSLAVGALLIGGLVASLTVLVIFTFVFLLNNFLLGLIGGLGGLCRHCSNSKYCHQKSH